MFLSTLQKTVSNAIKYSQSSGKITTKNKSKYDEIIVESQDIEIGIYTKNYI
ncbi:MAG: hypothetical protein H7195_08440 [Chryseobacterium sp.]|nr:hypothetical protein [Chryseobacterium sp.]